MIDEGVMIEGLENGSRAYGGLILLLNGLVGVFGIRIQVDWWHKNTLSCLSIQSQ